VRSRRVSRGRERGPGGVEGLSETLDKWIKRSRRGTR
jgi:hypothetical protein